MSEKKHGIRNRFFGKKRSVIAAGVVLAVAAGLVVGSRFLHGEQKISFSQVEESQIPKEIAADIIPEYKSLERALACMIDDEVYVVVTRGEKPTSGFQLSVEQIVEEEENNRSNLAVYAKFKDPQKKTAISQVITYPVAVVKTDLKKLPDTIELRIRY